MLSVHEPDDIAPGQGAWEQNVGNDSYVLLSRCWIPEERRGGWSEPGEPHQNGLPFSSRDVAFHYYGHGAGVGELYILSRYLPPVCVCVCAVA